MSVKTKAVIRTLGFVVAALVGGAIGGLTLIVVDDYFGPSGALIVFGAVVLSYMTWLVYDYNVSQIEFEEKFSKK